MQPLFDALARYGGLLGMVLTLIWGVLMVLYYREQFQRFRRPGLRREALYVDAALASVIPAVVGIASLALFIWSF